MLTVYITTPGTKIFKEGDVLKVMKDGATYHTIFPFRTEQVVVFGGVEVSSSAMKTFLRNGIDVVFLNKNGHYNGKLIGPYDTNVLLRRMQYRMLDDATKCVSFARSVVQGKIRNQLVILQRVSRFQKRDLKKEVQSFRQILEGADQAPGIPELRGFEGACARVYFSVFDKGFVTSQGFTKRVRRPPTDPVNAVLSFLYTVLFNRVGSAIERLGLDPYVGIFHAIGYGSQALALDLMEEFRPIIVDTLVFSLFNLSIVGTEDFRTISSETRDLPQSEDTASTNVPDVLKDRMGSFSETAQELFQDYELTEEPATSMGDDGHGTMGARKEPVLLTRPALQKVILQFERKLETEFHHPVENVKMTYREAITAQVRQFVSFLRGEQETYVPLVMR